MRRLGLLATFIELVCKRLCQLFATFRAERLRRLGLFATLGLCATFGLLATFMSCLRRL